jgi:threonine synthase
MGKFTGYQCSLCEKFYSRMKVQYLCPEDGANLNVVLDYDAIRQNADGGAYYVPAASLLSGATCRCCLSATRGQNSLPCAPRAGRPFISRPQLARSWACAICGSKMRAATRPPPSRIAPVRWWWPVPARSGRRWWSPHRLATPGPRWRVWPQPWAAVVIFAPKTAPPSKIAQLLVYNAQVILVDGNYDQAFDLTVQAAQHFGWYCRNTGFNPVYRRRQKNRCF